MIFKLTKVYLNLDIEKIRNMLLNPEFWEDMVDNAKRISVKKTNTTILHQEMLLEVEIDSLGLIKKDVETIQDVVFSPENIYFDEKEGANVQIIKVHTENSNQLRNFSGIIKIEEKNDKARLSFTLETMGLKDSLVELLGITLTNRRLKRELRRIMDKVFEYSKTGQLERFFKNN